MIDIYKIKELLPHRFPMLLIDRVMKYEAYKTLEAYKNVTVNEDVFNGHFPHMPIYPGVMILEGMAQACSILAYLSDENYKNKIIYFMSIDKAKFRLPIRPGDKLVYKICTLKCKKNVWSADARAYVDDKLACESELKAIIKD